MQGKFEISMMEELTFFLGLQIKQLSEDIFISQSKHIKEMLQRFDMENYKSSSIPMSPTYKLSKDEYSLSMNQKLYRGMIGTLLYLTTSRPDILISVCIYARFQVEPKESHLKSVKRIIKYLKGTKNVGLWYFE